MRTDGLAGGWVSTTGQGPVGSGDSCLSQVRTRTKAPGGRVDTRSDPVDSVGGDPTVWGSQTGVEETLEPEEKVSVYVVEHGV